MVLSARSSCSLPEPYRSTRKTVMFGAMLIVATLILSPVARAQTVTQPPTTPDQAAKQADANHPAKKPDPTGKTSEPKPQSKETPEQNGRKLIVRTFADRDLNFLKLLAQKLTRQSPNAIALLASTSPQPALIFAQSSGQPHDMGALLKETMTKLGGRGGGSKDMAQGGVPSADGLEDALADAATRL